MVKTDVFIENKIRWKASQHSLPTDYSFFFESMEKELKDSYLEKLRPIEIGTMVLVFLDGNSNWTILGTRAIANGNASAINSMPYSEIEEIDSLKTITDFNGNGIQHAKAIPKGEWNELCITDKKGKRIISITKPGSDFFSLFNILLMIKTLTSEN